MIQDIQNQLNDIQQYISTAHANQTFSNIEKDIILEKIRRLYDMILQNNVLFQPAETNITNEPVHENNADSEDPLIELNEPNNETTTIGEEIANSTMELVDYKEQAPSNHTEPAEIIPLVETNIVESTPKTPEIQKPSPSISNKKTDVGTQLAKQPITNISSAIGINERFQFIKELFKNDVTVYNTTIAYLNSLNSMEAAIQHITTNFDWDMEHATVQRFLTIIERRYL